tara:strand:+ start:9618 stop:9953 length:336 start_codon:yes stop_codon:yes gene_type:complete
MRYGRNIAMFITGILAALGLLLLIFKLGIRKVIAFDIPVDIAITSFLVMTFAGSYAGMVAALIGGLFVSVVLFVLRKTISRDEPTIVTEHANFKEGKYIPSVKLQWVRKQP